MKKNHIFVINLNYMNRYFIVLTSVLTVLLYLSTLVYFIRKYVKTELKMVDEILNEISNLEKLEDWTELSIRVNKSISENKISDSSVIRILKASNEKLKSLV